MLGSNLDIMMRIISKYIHYSLLPILVLAAILIACRVYAQDEVNQIYQSVEWTELMPKDDLDALMNPPDYLLDIADGTEDDSLQALSNTKQLDDKTKRYEQALTSYRVSPEYNNKNIRIAGFVVPVEVDPSQKAISFFIVPYFGACLHMPPPPPNQIIYVDYEQGIKIDNLYDPFWFEGKLTIKKVEADVASSAYQMNVNQILAYEEEAQAN